MPSRGDTRHHTSRALGRRFVQVRAWRHGHWFRSLRLRSRPACPIEDDHLLVELGQNIMCVWRASAFYPSCRSVRGGGALGVRRSMAHVISLLQRYDNTLIWPYVHAVSGLHGHGVQELRTSLSAIASDFEATRRQRQRPPHVPRPERKCACTACAVAASSVTRASRGPAFVMCWSNGRPKEKWPRGPKRRSPTIVSQTVGGGLHFGLPLPPSSSSRRSSSTSMPRSLSSALVTKVLGKTVNHDVGEAWAGRAHCPQDWAPVTCLRTPFQIHGGLPIPSRQSLCAQASPGRKHACKASPTLSGSTLSSTNLRPSPSRASPMPATILAIPASDFGSEFSPPPLEGE